MSEVLILSDVGLQAINNASAGGQLVDATFFKFGDSSQSPSKTDAVDILGNNLFEGTIHHVEVLSKNTARFVFEIPGYLIKEDTEVRETCVYLSSRTLLGRCVFETPYILIKGETVRFNCLLVTSRCDLTTINVTIGDYSSIPSTPNVFRLQSPGESSFNAVTVLDGTYNSDGSATPVLAMRSGAGGFQWAFSDHDRIFFGKPTAASATEITLSGIDLDDNEIVIGHVVLGNGQGKSRRYRVSGTKLVEADSQPVTGLDAQSTIAVWRRRGGAGGAGGACSYPPIMDGVPADWVLVRGYDECPRWAPPKSSGGINSTLYRAPSKLVMSTINYTGDGTEARYALGDLEIENVNYLQPALGGVTQHRDAFDMSGNEIEFVEAIAAQIPIDLRLFTRIPSNGSRMLIKVDHVVGDGSTQNFKISQPVQDANYIKAYIRGIRQMLTTFTYDATTQEVKFVAPIPAGVDVELRSFRIEDFEGYSTTISTIATITSDDTYFLELPFTPQSVEYIEVSQSGAHIHGNQYTLVDNKVIFTGPIRKGLGVEITLYDNAPAQGSSNTNLAGVVVDAVLTGRTLKLLRHGAKPIVLPVPGVSLIAGSGIRISGSHPVYRIESTISEQLTDAEANFKFTDTRNQKDAQEILFTHRVNLSSDVMVTVHADFQAALGPGFVTEEGLEIMEYVVGFRSSKSQEPDYGRQIAGTGTAGFSSLGGDKNERAYSNASLTQVYDIVTKNHPAGYIDVVVKMRVKNANVSQYGSFLNVNVNIIGTPKIAK
jgi:hypothetical protein